MYHELPKTLAAIKTGSEEYKQIVRGVAEKLYKLIKSRREGGAKRESSSTVKERSEKVDLGTGTADWLEFCLSPEIQSVFTKPIPALPQQERWSDYYSFIVGNIGNFKRIRAF